MSLTYQQMRMVKGTIPLLHEHGEHIATVFYKTMLKEHPELNNYFNKVNMQSGAQPRALTKLILAFASNISHISDLVPKLERVANKHASLGIHPEHYEIVCTYLMRAFAAVLGSTMTSEIRLAWTKAYWIMANMLTMREAQIYRDFESWAGFRRFVVDKKIRETMENDHASFELKPVDGVPLPSYMPGQYVSLRVRTPGTGYLQIRQYSLSDAPRPDHYRITVKRVMERHVCLCDPALSTHSTHSGHSGHSSRSARSPRGGSPRSLSRSSSFSTAVASTDGESFLGGVREHGVKQQGVVSNLLIDDILEGDVLEISHPAGDFFLDMDDSRSTPLILISAGGGCAPIMSMLSTVLEKDPDRPISWVQGAKKSMPFEKHINDLKKTHPQLRTTFIKTGLGNKDIAESTDSSGFGYYLEWLRPEEMFFGNRSAEYYICGPERFMLDLSNYLIANGVAKEQVRYDSHSTGSFELKDTCNGRA